MSVVDEGAGELQGSERHAPLLECQDIVVDFGSNRALDGVSLSIRPGEIIGLVGPNGAGKSTLGRVFVGELPYGSYDGLLRVGGVQTHFRDTRDAHRRGVVLIHQEGAAVRDLSIGENVMLTVEPRRFGIIDWNALHERAELALRQLGVTADTRTRLADVGGVALEEMVEIARSLVRGSKVFVFDESTAALGIDEVKILLKRMHELAGRGAGIVFISHRLDEVLSVCDRIVVLRDGRICLDSQRSDEDHSSVLSAMLGEDVAASEADAANKTGDALAACDSRRVRTTRRSAKGLANTEVRFERDQRRTDRRRHQQGRHSWRVRPTGRRQDGVSFFPLRPLRRYLCRRVQPPRRAG